MILSSCFIKSFLFVYLSYVKHTQCYKNKSIIKTSPSHRQHTLYLHVINIKNLITLPYICIFVIFDPAECYINTIIILTNTLHSLLLTFPSPSHRHYTLYQYYINVKHHNVILYLHICDTSMQFVVQILLYYISIISNIYCQV